MRAILLALWFIYLFSAQMKFLTPLFWIKLHPGVRCCGLSCQNNVNPWHHFLFFSFFFFYLISCSGKSNANVNDLPAESLKQQRWIGCRFSSWLRWPSARRHVNVCQQQMKKWWKWSACIKMLMCVRDTFQAGPSWWWGMCSSSLFLKT